MSIVAYGFAITPAGVATTIRVQELAVEVESTELQVVLEDSEIQVEVP